MEVYEGLLSVKHAVKVCSDEQLRILIGRRVDELSGYEEFYNSICLQLIVVNVGDVFLGFSEVLDFCLYERNCDAVEKHERWFELTFVIGDEALLHKRPANSL